MTALVMALLLAVVPAAIAKDYLSFLGIALLYDGPSEAHPYPTDRERAAMSTTNGNRRLSATLGHCCTADACGEFCVLNRCLNGCCRSSKCDPIPNPAPNPPPLSKPVRDPFQRVYVLNNCDSSIRVAIRYLSWNDNDWKSDGWWTLAPGGSAYIANTANRYIYTYAEGVENSARWQGDYCFSVGNRSVCGKKVDIGRGQGIYTHPFTCTNRG